jgi:magnesium transporter
MLFVVLKTARYDDASEAVEFAELHLFVGPSFVVTVRRGQASALSETRRRLEANRELLSHGPASVLHAVIDKVVDDYTPVIAGLDNDISEIEADVFRADRFDPSHRIYLLKREVLDFHRNTKPFLEALGNLANGRVPHCNNPDLQDYFRDVHDHLLLVVSEIEGFSALLSDMLQANLAQITVRQNDDMRKMSAWLAIGAFPTVVGAIYGMNFEHMPELTWTIGYPLVLGFTALVILLLYRQFKRSGWL